MKKLILQGVIAVFMTLYALYLLAVEGTSIWNNLMLAAGLLFLAAEFFQIRAYRQYKERKAQEAEAETQKKRLKEEKRLPDGALERPKRIRIIPTGDARMNIYKVFLNGVDVGECDASKPLIFSSEKIENTVKVIDDGGVESQPFVFKVIKGSERGELLIGLGEQKVPFILLPTEIKQSDQNKGLEKVK